jgi:simple sugar transport system ATP-binding protein
MRAGRMVGTVQPASATRELLAEMMVGRQVLLQVEKEPAEVKQVVLRIVDLRVADDRRHMAVDGISLQVRGGEILGVAGVQGNGQTELAEALTGLRKAAAGHIYINEVETTVATPRQLVEGGLAHIPEDRQKHGLVMSFPIRDNLVLCSFYSPPYATGAELDYAAISKEAEDLVRKFDVRTPSIMASASTLSGGNQQKVIAARELSRIDPSDGIGVALPSGAPLLVANQPTRGLDVGSIEFIHSNIVEARDRGVAVLLISAELDEVMSLSDRIAVIYKGRILETVDAETATREQLGLLMAGVTTTQEGGHV